MPLDQIAKRVSAVVVSTIVKVKGKEQWYIESEPGKKYDSRAKAEKRLQQIHAFEHMKGKKKGKKRKSSVLIACRIAGANIFERLTELDCAIEKAEADESKDELEKLKQQRAEVLDAIECEEESSGSRVGCAAQIGRIEVHGEDIRQAFENAAGQWLIANGMDVSAVQADPTPENWGLKIVGTDIVYDPPDHRMPAEIVGKVIA
jgi:hypothetical protein